MSYSSETPCGQRVACGMKCARQLGQEFQEKLNRAPNWSEVMAHVEGHKFVPKHRESMFQAAQAAARTAKAKGLIPHWKKQAEHYAPLFEKMGYILYVWTHGQYDGNYCIVARDPSNGIYYACNDERGVHYLFWLIAKDAKEMATLKVA